MQALVCRFEILVVIWHWRMACRYEKAIVGLQRSGSENLCQDVRMLITAGSVTSSPIIKIRQSAKSQCNQLARDYFRAYNSCKRISGRRDSELKALEISFRGPTPGSDHIERQLLFAGHRQDVGQHLP